jgi:hypothetical protein
MSNFSSEFINSIRNYPVCPICSLDMEPHHTRIWNGKGYSYVSIGFWCTGKIKPFHHSSTVKATTEAEWDVIRKFMTFSEDYNFFLEK